MDDLLREFLTETSESLDVADVELVKFEQDPNNAQILNNIFRLVHTIKGTCGFIGLPRLASLAHAAETLMDRFREGRPVTTDAVGLVLSTIDRIKLLLQHVEETEGSEPEGEDRDLISLLEAMAEAVDAPATPPPAPPSQPAQTLERPLLPGELPLDELDRIFRETKVDPITPPAAAPPVAKAAPPKSAPAMPKADVEAAHGAAQAGEAHGVAAQSIRVHVGVLEQLMTMVSELVLTRNQLMEIARRHDEPEYKVSLQRLSNVTGELQEAVMRTRMQPIGNAWQKLPRIVRDLAQELGKQIELEQVGADTELDRQVLDQIKDPLTHMVRNSADHGLEMPEQRRAAGKSERGLIRLSAYHEGGHVIVEISDDGRGLDVARIKQKALENGLATEAELAKMPDSQVFRFIFHAGLSTAQKVTNVSGRGVGMDVVRSNLESIGGTVDVRSRQGEGSTFVIKIPLTLAIVPALIVRAAGERFALPQSAVEELVRVQAGSDHEITWLNNSPVLGLRDRLLPIVSLGALLGLSPERDGRDEALWERALIVVMKVGHQTFGVVVEAVSHTEEIVVKPMASALRQLPMVSGSTILGDGRVIMILDPAGLAQHAAARGGAAEETSHHGAGRQSRASQKRSSLLLFRAGSRDLKAVPLGLVTRIEELEVARIERVNGYPVLQYRGALIPVLYANEEVQRVAAGTQPMLVFADGGRVMGLVVDEIVDIVEAELDLELSPSNMPEVLGAAVLSGQATEILDVAFYVQVAFGERFRHLVRSSERPRLLLVDESPFHRDLLAPMLNGNGYEVTACASGGEALARLGTEDGFDAIVSDVDLPDMDGFALAAAVRGDPRIREVPIIALATAQDRDALERGRAVGFTDCVAKFDRSGLIAALKEFTGRQGIAA